MLSKRRQQYWQERLAKANREQKSITDMRPVFVAMGPWAEEVVDEWAANNPDWFKERNVKCPD